MALERSSVGAVVYRLRDAGGGDMVLRRKSMQLSFGDAMRCSLVTTDESTPRAVPAALIDTRDGQTWCLCRPRFDLVGAVKAKCVRPVDGPHNEGVAGVSVHSTDKRDTAERVARPAR
jgi:hypothetical protein